MQVTAKTKDHAPVTVEKDIPTDLKGLVAAFGEDVIASSAHGAVVISLQSFMRSHIDDKDLQKQVNEWKPGVRTRGPKKSASEKAVDLFSKMSPEEQKALLAQLKSAK